jgi:hypothetical protein
MAPSLINGLLPENGSSRLFWLFLKLVAVKVPKTSALSEQKYPRLALLLIKNGNFQFVLITGGA